MTSKATQEHPWMRPRRTGVLAASDYNLYSSRATSDETEGAPQTDGGEADRRTGPGWGAGVPGFREAVRGLPVAGWVGAG